MKRICDTLIEKSNPKVSFMITRLISLGEIYAFGICQPMQCVYMLGSRTGNSPDYCSLRSARLLKEFYFSFYVSFPSVNYCPVEPKPPELLCVSSKLSAVSILGNNDRSHYHLCYSHSVCNSKAFMTVIY